MAETLEERITTLERRVSDWEGQMGFLVPIVKQLHREVIVINDRLERVEVKVDSLEQKVDAGFAATLKQFQAIEVRFSKIDNDLSQVKAAVDALPRAVAEIIGKQK